jgi:hypothetical protein
VGRRVGLVHRIPVRYGWDDPTQGFCRQPPRCCALLWETEKGYSLRFRLGAFQRRARPSQPLPGARPTLNPVVSKERSVMSTTDGSNGQVVRYPSFPDPIPDIIRQRTVSILAGPGRTGKSTLWYDWEKRMQDGRTINRRPTGCPTGFKVIGLDRGIEEEYAPKFKLVGLNPADVSCFCPVDDPDFKLERFRTTGPLLDKLLDECFDRVLTKAGNLVTIEGYSPLFIRGCESDPRAVRLAMLHLKQQQARRRNIAIMLILHHGKQLGDPKQQYSRLIDRIAGSRDWAASSDTQLALIEPENGHPFYQLEWNPSHIPREEFAYRRLPSGLFAPWEGQDDHTAPPTPLSEPAKQFFSLIPSNDIETTALFEQAATQFGFSQSSCYVYLKELGDSRLVRTRGKVRRRQPS